MDPLATWQLPLCCAEISRPEAPYEMRCNAASRIWRMGIDHDEGPCIYMRKNQLLHHLLVHLQIFPSLFGITARDSPVGFVEISWAHDKVVHTSCLRRWHAVFSRILLKPVFQGHFSCFGAPANRCVNAP